MPAPARRAEKQSGQWSRPGEPVRLMRGDMALYTIEVERSPICRPDSDCWHVKLFFFFPARQVQTVRKIYRFAVDVSDVVPVTVGPVISWFVR